MVSKIHRGFVLLIVIGVVSTLSMIAILFADSTSLTAKLSVNAVSKTRSRLSARSGVEIGKRIYVEQLIHFDPASEIREFEMLSPESSIAFKVHFFDTSAAININDGVSAGFEEMGEAYQANVLDPWPDSTSGDFSTDTSAWINLRIRRILNAYGDVWKFKADIGEPIWKKDVNSNLNSNWQVSFDFTSSTCGPRYRSMPDGDGLGDLVVINRPTKGYFRVQDVKQILNAWGEAHLLSVNPNFLNDTSFYELIKNDLTVSSYEDDAFARQTRELGGDEDGDGYADCVAGKSNSPWNYSKVPLDSEPPNFSDLWREHEVAQIDINRASHEVRSAIFYAPVNVSMMVEGSTRQFNTYPDTNVEMLQLYRPTYGVGLLAIPRQTFSNADVFENGVATSGQRRRLMSLRDAMVLSRAYTSFATFDGLGLTYSGAGASSGFFPDGFAQFRTLLENVSYRTPQLSVPAHTKKNYERVDSTYKFPAGTVHSISNSTNLGIDQDYVSRILPIVLSGIRRLPGWMNAPVSLMSRFAQIGQGSSEYDSLISIEDFVFRSHLPKIRFMPGGTLHVESQGFDPSQAGFGETRIVADIKILETVVHRSQMDFQNLTDITSSPEIHFGPEPNGPGKEPNSSGPDPSVMSVMGYGPHNSIGVVGLKDREEKIDYGVRKHSISMNFSGNYKEGEVGDKNYAPAIASVDPFNYADGTDGIEISAPSGYEDKVKPGFIEPAVFPGVNEQGRFPNGKYVTMEDLREEFSKIFDKPMYNAYLTIPPAGKTWRQPTKSPLDILNEIVSQYFSESHFMSHIWPKYVFDPSLLPNPPFRFIDYTSPKTLAEFKAFITDIKLGFVFTPSIWESFIFGGPFPNAPAGDEFDLYKWWIQNASNSKLSGLKEKIADRLKKWPETWPYYRQPRPEIRSHDYLLNSGLEDNSVSLFENGSDGCDLSPFGGVSFSSRGHGPMALKAFSDSLYWRPYEMINSQALSNINPGDSIEESVGNVFNKGTVSFWYRVPSGMNGQYQQRCLFHMTLWEKVEMLKGASPNNSTIAVSKSSLAAIPDATDVETEVMLRPVHITAYLENLSQTGKNLNGQVYEPRYGHSYPIVQVSNGLPGDQGLPGTPRGYGYILHAPYYDESKDMSIPENYVVNYDGLNPANINNRMIGVPSKVFNYHSSDGRHAGYEYDRYFRLFQPYSYYYNMVPGQEGQKIEDYKPADKAYVDIDRFQSSQYDQRKFGMNSKQVDRWRPGSWVRCVFSWDYDLPANNGETTLSHRLKTGSFIHDRSVLPTSQGANPIDFRDAQHALGQQMIEPFIDQMVITFGERPHLLLPPRFYQPNMDEFKLLEQTYLPLYRLNSSIDNIDIRFGSNLPGSMETDYPGMESRRYDVRADNEPTWNVLPVQPSSPEGMILFSVGARVYDVVGDEGSMATPWVDLKASANGIDKGLEIYKTDSGSTYPFKSVERLVFDVFDSKNRIDDNARISMTWRATEPDTSPNPGADYMSGKILANIPWVKEISYQFYLTNHRPINWCEE